MATTTTTAAGKLLAMDGGSREYEELRELLRSWNVIELYSHFKEEGINVEELQMMKRQHLADILRNFRYGTRIRFEHHLERWRRLLCQPLQGSTSHASMHCSGCRCYAASPPTLLNDDTGRSEMELHDDTAANALLSIPEPYVALSEHNDLVEPADFGKEEVMEHSPNLKMQHNANNGSGSNSGSVCGDAEGPSVSVLGILQASGIPGQALLLSRGQPLELQHPQRMQLIQLICNYYGDNNLHLTLQRSHLLEQEILELFPREQLHYYRTERRGKIYVKFTNMKRFKRVARDRHKRHRSEGINATSRAPPPLPNTGITTATTTNNSNVTSSALTSRTFDTKELNFVSDALLG